jgi:hypothetical protein
MAAWLEQPASSGFTGLIWAFDGLIGGEVFAWLYNKLTGSAESK